jgi:hypothetical protein
MATYPFPPDIPDLETLRNRLDEVGAMLDSIVNDLVFPVVSRIEDQEVVLREVYRPLVRSTTNAVRSTRNVLGPVVDDVLSSVRGSVFANQADLIALQGAAEVADRVAKAPGVPQERSGDLSPAETAISPPLPPEPGLKLSNTILTDGTKCPGWYNPINPSIILVDLISCGVTPEQAGVDPARVVNGWTWVRHTPEIGPTTDPSGEVAPTPVLPPESVVGPSLPQQPPFVIPPTEPHPDAPVVPGPFPSPQPVTLPPDVPLRIPPAVIPPGPVIFPPTPPTPPLAVQPPVVRPEHPVPASGGGVGGVMEGPEPLGPPPAPPEGEAEAAAEEEVTCQLSVPWHPEDPVFCQQLEQLARGVSRVGTLLIDPFCDLLNTDWSSVGLQLLVSAIPGGSLVQAVLPEIGPKELLNIAKTACACARSIGDAEIRGGPAMLAGLWFLKGLIGSLESLFLGWELGPQVIAQVNLEFSQLRTIIGYLVEWTWPVRIPDMPGLNSSYLGNLLGRDHYRCLTEMNGQVWPLTEKVIHSQRSRLNDDQIMRIYLRLRNQKNWSRRKLRENGWLNELEVDTLEETYAFVPPPSDLIRFAIRDVFLADLPGRQEMLAELNEQRDLLGLFSAQGIGDLNVVTQDGTAKTYNVPELYWLASFEMPSPSQAYEMLHRLRQGRTAKWSLADPQGQPVEPRPVDLPLVRALLKDKDYSPIWRDRLAAIAYRVIGRIDLKRLYVSGQFGPPQGTAGFSGSDQIGWTPTGAAEIELYESFQDAGYAPPDATRLARYAAWEWERGSRSKFQARLVSEALNNWQQGAFGDEQLHQYLVRAGLSEADATRAVEFAYLRDNSKRFKDIVDITRRKYLRAEISESQAQQSLLRAGLDARRLAVMLNHWRLLLFAKSKEVSAEKLCKWYKEDIIDRSTLLFRLSNLGFTDPDSLRMARSCEISKVAISRQDHERQIRQEQRREEAKRAALEKAQRSAEKDLADRAKQRLLGKSESNLRRWAKAKLITRAEAESTLRERGWDNSAVLTWLREQFPQEEADNAAET